MHILILSSDLYPSVSGIAHYLKNFTELLAIRGHEVTIIGHEFTSECKPCEEIINGVRIVRVQAGISNFPHTHMPYWPAVSYQIAEKVLKYIEERGKPDIIESQECAAVGYFLIKEKLHGHPLLQDVPIVVMLHTARFQAELLDGFPGYRLPAWYEYRLEKLCILSADGVAAPSHFILDKAEKELRVNLNCAEVIPHPLDPSLLGEIRCSGLTPTYQDIIYFGRYQALKGVPALLQACHQLWEEGYRFRLTLIGKSLYYPRHNCKMKDYITRNYQQYIDQGRLVLEPAMQKPALYERIAKAWCVVIPSLWESFSNVCMEAMLLQKVVLASSDGGMKEMLHYTDKPAGFIFDWNIPGDFAEKLQQILDLSIEENLAIGKNAREAILQMCAPERIISLRLKHFQQVIANSQSQSRRLYPSLNYQPTGKIAYPPRLEPVGVLGRVSVCIPYYNMGRYIRETLDSVYQVNYPDLEVIIWDDGSTDAESVQVLAQVQKEYSGLKVYRGENQGLAGARNSLAQVATGEFLAFLDADDKVHPDYYPKAVQILRQYDNVGIVACWIQHFGENDHRRITWDGEFPFLLCHNPFPSAVVVKKSVYLHIGGMKPALSQMGGIEDWECWINMHKQGWLGVVIPEFYFYYRIRSDSMFHGMSKETRLRCEEAIVDYHRELYQQYGDEIFKLCNQNEIAPIYWHNPAQSYSLPPTTQQELATTKAELTYTTQQLQTTQQELEWLRQELDRIKGSRFWKVWQVLRKVKKSVTGVFQPRTPDAQK